VETNRPIFADHLGKPLNKKLYFLSDGIFPGGGIPLPASILTDRSQKRTPCG
jgi:hypothetical protein